MSKFKKGDTVKHSVFGVGIIKEVRDEFATVIFEKTGTRKIDVSYLRECSSKANPIKINSDDKEQQILDFIINKFSELNVTYLAFYTCCRMIDNELRLYCRISYYREVLEPFNDVVYLKHISKIYKNRVKKDLDYTNENSSLSEVELRNSIAFKYHKQTDKLKKTLSDDLYLLKDFKALMLSSGIPITELNLDVVLDAVGFKIRAKNIVLRSTYSSLADYYRCIISKDDVYHYSNPLNLDEYDTVLHYLLNNLFIIEVGSGVYLTEKNMLSNNVNRNTIWRFQEGVISIGKKLKFFSINEIKERLKYDPVVNYCNDDMNQLLQFIKPIKTVYPLKMDKNSYIFAYSEEKKKRSDFIIFMLGKDRSISIDDLQTFVSEAYGVEYPIEFIERDLKETYLYYSPEMEKIYKDKKDFISEVYHK